MADDTALPGMDGFVNGVVDIEGVLVWWERSIEVCLSDIGLEAINLLQCSIGIE